MDRELEQALTLLRSARQRISKCRPQLEKLRNEREEAKRKLAKEQLALAEEEEADYERHEREQRNLLEQIKNFKAERKSLREQTKVIKERLDEQAAEMRKKHHIHTEPSCLRDQLVRMFVNDLQQKARNYSLLITSRPAFEKKVKVQELQDHCLTVMRLMAICLVDIFRVCHEQFQVHRESLCDVLRKRGLSVADEEGTHHIIADMLRNAVTVHMPKQVSQDTDQALEVIQPPPPDFSLEAICRDRKMPEAQKALNQLSKYSAMAEGEAQWQKTTKEFIDAFLQNCCKFSWNWLLYHHHSDILFQSEGSFSRELCQLCEEQKYHTPERHSPCCFLWPALRNHMGGVLVRAVVMVTRK